MRQVRIAAALLAAGIAGCSSGGTPSTPVVAASAAGSTAIRQRIAPAAVKTAAVANGVANPGFETGSLSSWSACGSVSSQTASTVQAHSGSYSALIGKTAKPEVNGTAGLCQTVTIPTGGVLSFWVYEGTSDTIKYVDQEADLYDTSGDFITQLYVEAKSTGGWVQKSFDVSSYAGRTVQLYFGIAGNGYASDYVYEYLDDVSLTAAGATAAPTTAPTAKPTTAPTSGPTAKPTTAPTSAPFACNNQQFASDQSAFAAGTITADQPEDVCGAVTQVLAEKDTTSGHHGYFYVQLPSGYQIEIVSNLDAMAEASTDQPPSTWPWVAVNQYVYVQGRYYYDSSSSQGIDWTEDDTSSSWSHLGYVAVCNTSGTGCQKYW